MSEKRDISPTMCAFPWIHSHAWPDGKAMLCCIAHGGEKYGKVGDFSTHSYAEIMNSEKMKQVRLDLMNGVEVKECEACWINEKRGKKSFRQSNLQNYEIDPLIENTLPDGTLKEIQMLYMDFRFSNLCNLGCQTCGSPLSSKLANDRKNKNEIEHLKRKNVLSDRETITSFVYARPDFMETDVYPYIEDCEGFYFAGGEPLMHKEHLDILNYLNENEQYSKRITYSTNLSILKWKGVDFLDIWKNFNNILFWCSIDGHGEQLEYVREYSKHDTIFSNLRKLLDLKEKYPNKNYKVQICYTHSVYNSYYLKEFIEFLYEENLLQRIDDLELNFAYGDTNTSACLPDFAKIEWLEKTENAKSSEAIQYACDKFYDFKHAYERSLSVINEPVANNSFDIAYTKHFKKDIDKIKTKLPWLYSVIERYRII
jgi:hypothetical protein